MSDKKNDIAVIIMGPPGAGKTTQSEVLARRFKLVHVITSELIKDALYDYKNQNDPVIAREKNIFESGGINTPEWVTEMTLAKTEKVARSKKGIVYSASPRTLYEAKAMMPLLKRLYSPDKIFIFFLILKLEEAEARIRERRVCSGCGLPLLPQENKQVCSVCGGVIKQRALDDGDRLKRRFDQYRERTEPVIDFFKEERMSYLDIDGSLSMDRISAKLLAQICRLYQN